MKKRISYRVVNALLFLHVLLLSSSVNSQENTLLNFIHINSLYEEIEINGKPSGILYIYSEYPGYEPIGDDDEGITCVDDMARGAVLFLKHYELTGDEKSIDKAEHLLNTVLYMQDENGLFYNFLNEKIEINKTHINSRSSDLSWWTARAVWALGYAYKVFHDLDETQAILYKQSVEKVYPHIINNFENYNTYDRTEGIEHPLWLISGSASDATSEMLLGLIEIYRIDKNRELRNIIEKLTDGLMALQVKGDQEFPFGAFLSWKNLWHAWGNSQSYALLNAYEELKDERILEAAIREIDYFYKILAENDLTTGWKIKLTEDKTYEVSNVTNFPQIAYNMRPIITALCKAGEITNNNDYFEQAIVFYSWFLGENVSHKLMYDPRNGKCFDGIDAENEINLNSGAESTIEALLSTIEIERIPYTREKMHNYWQKKYGRREYDKVEKNK